MKVSTRGILSASAYADRRLELDARQPDLLQAAIDLARESVREQYQAQIARLAARVPEQSRQRAEALYIAAKAATTDDPAGNGSEAQQDDPAATSSPIGPRVSNGSGVQDHTHLEPSEPATVEGETAPSRNPGNAPREGEQSQSGSTDWLNQQPPPSTALVRDRGKGR